MGPALLASSLIKIHEPQKQIAESDIDRSPRKFSNETAVIA
jgi:hypothetical protein